MTEAAAPVKGTRPEGALTEADASSKIREMFTQIAPRYDLLNHLLSLQLDRLSQPCQFRSRLVRDSARAQTRRHHRHPGIHRAARRFTGRFLSLVFLQSTAEDWWTYLRRSSGLQISAEVRRPFFPSARTSCTHGRCRL